MALHGYAGQDPPPRHVGAARRSRSRPRSTARWGGGHGLGSALFWDFCKDKTIKDGRNPANVCCVCTSPLYGTIVPSATGRCEVVGVGVGQHPQNWFTRSGFGGRFSTMLKYAGWDAIVITGKADKPTWVDIRNDKVTFHDAAGLWGKDTWTTQHDDLGADRPRPRREDGLAGRTGAKRRGPRRARPHDAEAGRARASARPARTRRRTAA